MTSIEEFNNWLKRPEGINLEFKEAKNQFGKDKDLPDYCAALANEGGGKLILGVNDNHHVVGTKAFLGDHYKLSNKLLNNLGIRIDVEELSHPDGRVLIFHVPSRPLGQTIKSTGNYRCPMRAGESLVEMDDLTLKRVLNESSPDFSCLTVEGLSLKDLDELALKKLRDLLYEKTKNSNYQTATVEQFLNDLGLFSEKGLNFACLILIGKKEALDNHLPQAEIIFEWRQLPGKTPYDFRKSWREPFMNIFNDIWEELDKRNLRTPYQEGFIQKEILAFDRQSIREAILNAVAHRDYSLVGNVVFISASPAEFLIESPGGFLPGITPSNALFKRAWRNQRLAEMFEKAGLIDRSGQGLDLIFQKTIKDGKGLPDLLGSDTFTVRLKIPASVKDKNFILFIEKIANEKQISFSFDEILELESIREHQIVKSPAHKARFLSLNVIEKVGSGRGIKYILSHKYYTHEGKPGVHTKLKGISRDQKKMLIFNHIKDEGRGFSKDLQEALDLDQRSVNNILQELRKEGKVTHQGSRKSGFWVLK